MTATAGLFSAAPMGDSDPDVAICRAGVSWVQELPLRWERFALTVGAGEGRPIENLRRGGP